MRFLFTAETNQKVEESEMKRESFRQHKKSPLSTHSVYEFRAILSFVYYKVSFCFINSSSCEKVSGKQINVNGTCRVAPSLAGHRELLLNGISRVFLFSKSQLVWDMRYKLSIRHEGHWNRTIFFWFSIKTEIVFPIYYEIDALHSSILFLLETFRFKLLKNSWNEKLALNVEWNFRSN